VRAETSLTPFISSVPQGQGKGRHRRARRTTPPTSPIFSPIHGGRSTRCAPSDGSAGINPKIALIVRGGSWLVDPGDLRAAFRRRGTVASGAATKKEAHGSEAWSREQLHEGEGARAASSAALLSGSATEMATIALAFFFLPRRCLWRCLSGSPARHRPTI
jgi:hypothetical protein